LTSRRNKAAPAAQAFFVAAVPALRCTKKCPAKVRPTLGNRTRLA
jgi:hypothetical protein